MAFDFSTLITDRSPADLEALRGLLSTPMADWTAEQLAAFNQAASKGAYNYTDLNRVTAAMDDINTRLTSLGYNTGYTPIVVHPPDPNPVIPLPEGYTKVMWIESTGAQYIDTGFKPNSNTRAVIKIQCLKGSTGGNYPGILSARNSDFSNSFSLFITSANKYMTAYNANMGDDFGAFDTQIHVFDKNKGVTYFDDTEVSTIVSSDFQCGFNLFLLASSSGASPAYDFLSAKIFYCQIYDNGTLVRDYVPCIAPSGEAGLYDQVNGQFYGNAGTGNFIPAPIPVNLPEGYIQLEYLESNGNQYIDSGIQLNGSYDFSVDFQCTNAVTGNPGVFGSRQPANNSYMLYLDNATTFYLNYGTSYLNIITQADGLTERHLVEKKGTSIYKDGVFVVNTGASSFTVGNNADVFSWHTEGNLHNMIPARIYSLSVTSGDTYIMRLIPSKRVSDGELGLYDLARSLFLTNAGSGTFVAGTEIYPPEPEPEPTPELDPYTWYEIDSPTESSMAAYLANVSALRGVLPLPENTAEVPADMAGLTLAEANAIEEILLVIEDYLTAMVSVFRRCGTAICGGPGFYFVN